MLHVGYIYKRTISGVNVGKHVHYLGKRWVNVGNYLG